MRIVGLTNSWAKGDRAINRRQGEAQAGLVGQSSVPDLVGDVADDTCGPRMGRDWMASSVSLPEHERRR
jgi:hypothetical protein